MENGYRGTKILADEAKESNNSGGLIMPLYEYLCKKCGQSFAFTMAVSEHEKKRDQCPHCNGTEIVPQSSRFSRRLQKKADDGSSRGSSGRILPRKKAWKCFLVRAGQLVARPRNVDNCFFYVTLTRQ